MKRMQTLQKRWSTDQLITGIEIPDWIRVLQQNDWDVSAAYLHRAAWITAWSLPATAAGRIEDALYGRQLASMDIDPTPIFVLGHWRSGTTHMHNLLGRDPQHTYSTVYQVVFPTSFLTTGNFLPQLTSRFLTDTRTYDNVKHGWNEAAEDEIALAKLTGLSPYLSFMFPDHAAKYEKYIDFMESTDAERQKWKDGFKYLLKKIMIQTGGKRVVVKSCTHTARVRLLLEMFPDARFVYIHRNPYEVFASTLHMRSHTDWENFLEVPYENWEEERERQTLMLGQRIFDRFVEDKHLIPKENYYEIAYADLCGNELPVLEDIYTKLRLPNWDRAKRTLKGYTEGLKGYQRNKLKMDKRLQDMVWEYWRTAFDNFGYTRDMQ
jgi:hypothetical protein